MLSRGRTHDAVFTHAGVAAVTGMGACLPARLGHPVYDYWAMAMPEFVGLLMAWIFGLLLDVAQGTILGQHALGLVLVIWLVQMTYLRIRVASLIQQALVIFVLLLAKLLLTLWVSGLVGQAPENITLYLLPSVTGALIWPWLFIVLRDIRRRYTLTNRF
ncbi:MAG TPA: rod shape-determining protein MreD [Gammaproteobacteria bacterium]|nr:rod shape-determining protein MreD [Gammaproteobacteria bacterium]